MAMDTDSTLHIVTSIISGLNLTVLIAFAIAWGKIQEKVRRAEKDINGVGRKVGEHLRWHLQTLQVKDNSENSDE